jgi:hypothetical protein
LETALTHKPRQKSSRPSAGQVPVQARVAASSG